MTPDECSQIMSQFGDSAYAEAVEEQSPGEYLLIVRPDKENDRTQNVFVSLDDQGPHTLVTAYSLIATCPDHPEILRDLMAENVHFHYSRLGVIGDKLVQIFRYPLPELGETEFLKAILEVVRQADDIEDRYFDSDEG